MTTLRELLTSPLAAIVTALTLIASLTGFLPALAHAIWVTVPTWYPALAVTSSVVAPQIGTITVPFVGVIDLAGTLQSATVGGAVIVVAYLADKGIEKFTNTLEDQ